jgi:5-formyltetrahydrofolate cyclo-ligase
MRRDVLEKYRDLNSNEQQKHQEQYCHLVAESSTFLQQWMINAYWQ